MGIFGALVPSLLLSSPLSSLVDDVRGVYSGLPPGPSSEAVRSYGTVSFHRHGAPEDRAAACLTRPVALYLPGLDGAGISGTAQFGDLARTFDLHRMTVSVDDRSSFGGLVQAVSDYLRDAALEEVVVIGESFGGLLAPAVALRAGPAAVSSLVLVNPATSFARTNWDVLGPGLASLGGVGATPEGFPSVYSVVGGMALSALVPDGTQFRKIGKKILDGADFRDPQGGLDAMRDGFGILEENLPAATVAWRTKNWLPAGAQVVNARLRNIEVPTLVVAGSDDNFLPSKEEAKRLCAEMPNCSKKVLKGGHFLLDDRVNLTQIILDSPLDPLKRPVYDPITDWVPPSAEELAVAVEEKVKPLRRLASPIFFSTGADGKAVRGLRKLPVAAPDKPVLFVANHQFGGLDLQVIIPQLLEERGIAARGLAHPVIFQAGGGGFGGDDGGAGNVEISTFQQFGAVMVTPRNYYRLMQTGQTALLFPGGVREVFHGKDEAYQLFWPEETDFVRTAARFNATVVPLAAVGAADSVNILIDAPDMLKLPFGLGERLANASAAAPVARFNMGEETFVAPLAVPKPLPARHYFLFGRPVDTTDVDHRDAGACAATYAAVRAGLERGFEELLAAREEDPYRDTPLRIATESVSGKQAPTFPVELLNRNK